MTGCWSTWPTRRARRWGSCRWTSRSAACRPADDDLRLLRAICSHAEQALESARQNERAAAHQRMLSQLLGASPALSACTTPDALLAEVCDAIVPHLGFERVAVYRTERVRSPDAVGEPRLGLAGVCSANR